MKVVSDSINNLDPNKDIDMKICRAGDWVSSSTWKEISGKCWAGNSSSDNSYKKLSQMFDESTSSASTNNYATTKTEKMGEHTSAKISKDISTNLNKDQKGIVSSAFAKAADDKICGKTGEIGILVLRKQMAIVPVVVMPILAASTS